MMNERLDPEKVGQAVKEALPMSEFATVMNKVRIFHETYQGELPPYFWYRKLI